MNGARNAIKRWAAEAGVEGFISGLLASCGVGGVAGSGGGVGGGYANGGEMEGIRRGRRIMLGRSWRNMGCGGAVLLWKVKGDKLVLYIRYEIVESGNLKLADDVEKYGDLTKKEWHG